MKKTIGLLLTIVALATTNITQADIDPNYCEQTKNDYFCAINGKTLTPCTAFSDTSPREMIPAYTGNCIDYPPLSNYAKQVIIDVIYDRLEPHIQYQALVQTEYNGTMIPVFHDIKSPNNAPPGTSRILTKLDVEGISMVVKDLFPAIAKAIKEEVEKEEVEKEKPNMMKVSILHHVAYMFLYDFDIIDDPTELNPFN